MIEFVNDKDRNLKNLKQVGTPREENKIYVDDFAYAKIKEDTYKEKRVFVLMGHTERMDGRYATFIEAVIPVKEIAFSGVLPKWSNATWREVFQEIKRLYEDMIIVGWAVDAKGMHPKLTPDFERVHREYFGGMHQLLFLLDTLEQEETFYMYKENKIVSKDGFYIYHRARRKEEMETRSEKRMTERELPKVNIEVEGFEDVPKRVGVYRQMLQEQRQEKHTEGGNSGLAIAVAMLVFVIGVGAFENRDRIFQVDTAVEADALHDQGMTEMEIDNIEETEQVETENDGVETLIPIEIIPGTESAE